MISDLILATTDSALTGTRERDHLFWGEQGAYFEITIRGQENY